MFPVLSKFNSRCQAGEASGPWGNILIDCRLLMCSLKFLKRVLHSALLTCRNILPCKIQYTTALLRVNIIPTFLFKLLLSDRDLLVSMPFGNFCSSKLALIYHEASFSLAHAKLLSVLADCGFSIHAVINNVYFIIEIVNSGRIVPP